MKKGFCICLALLAVLCVLVSCGKKSDTFKVGICQLVQHPALDSATKGFRDALTEKLGDKVVFDEQNASGESNNCATIINGFVSKNVDLIMANATSPLQAAASATADIPILGTSITNYPSALELDLNSWTGVVGRNISGTSDLAPLDQQAQIVKDWFPNAKTVGLLFCSSEANSLYQIQEIEKYLAAFGFKTKRFAFTDTNDIASVTQSACQSSDVIYIPTDNTAASNAEAIANIVLVNKVPVVAGEAELCKGCGVATLSIDYYDLGYKTGEMAADILANGADISKMEISFAPASKLYNADMCAKYGITPVAGYNPIK